MLTSYPVVPMSFWMSVPTATRLLDDRSEIIFDHNSVADIPIYFKHRAQCSNS